MNQTLASNNPQEVDIPLNKPNSDLFNCYEVKKLDEHLSSVVIPSFIAKKTKIDVGIKPRKRLLRYDIFNCEPNFY